MNKVILYTIIGIIIALVINIGGYYLIKERQPDEMLQVVSDECDLEGYFYVCTGTITTDDFDVGSYGIWFKDASKTKTGGTTGTTGDTVSVNITTTWKAKITDSDFTITGGAGGNGGTENPGGAGGNGNVNLNAPVAVIIQSIFTLDGGNGGVGGPSSDADCAKEAGGSGGRGSLKIYSSQNLTMTNVNATITAGDGGEANEGAGGGGGGSPQVNITTANIFYSNLQIDMTGGAGGRGDSCSDASDYAGTGGGGGSPTAYLIAVAKSNSSTTDIDMRGGLAGISEAVGTACVYGNSGGSPSLTINYTSSPGRTYHDFTTYLLGGAGNSVVGNCNNNLNKAGAGGSSTCIFDMGENASIELSSINITGGAAGPTEQDGNDGGSATLTIREGKNGEMKTSIIKAVGSAASGADTYYGGTGGGGTVYLVSTTTDENNRGTFNTTNITITGGTGGTTIGAGLDGGNGGATQFYLMGGKLRAEKLILSITGGTGGVGSAGNQGWGGVSNLRFHNNDANQQLNALVHNSTFTMEGGDSPDNTRDIAGRMYSNSSYLQFRNVTFNLNRFSGDNPVVDFNHTGDLDFQANTTFVIEGGTPSSSIDLRNASSHMLVWNTIMNFVTTVRSADAVVEVGRRGVNTTKFTYTGTSETNQTFGQYYIRKNRLQALGNNTPQQVYNSTDTYCEWNYSFANNADYYGDISQAYGNLTWKINGVANTDDYQINITLPYNVLNQTNASGTLEADDYNTSNNLSCIMTAWATDYIGNQKVEESNVTVSPEYPYNLKIDIGNDGSYEYTGTGVFNSSIQQIFPIASFNKYLQENCSLASSACNVPIAFISDSNATINITNITISYGTESPTLWPEVPFAMSADTSGNIMLSESKFNYYDLIAAIPVTAHGIFGVSSYSQTWYIHTRYSRFNLTLPRLYKYMDFVPETSNSKNVTPMGQTALIPIHNITALGEGNYSMDIRARLYSGGNACLSLYASRTNATAKQFNYTNTSVWYYFSNNTAYNEYIGLWYIADLNHCSGMYLISPQFYYESKCTDCVKW